MDMHLLNSIALANLNLFDDYDITYNRGYMPPEYINSGDISRKFDVFSLGVIIIRILDGNDGNSRRFDMPREQFIEFVSNRDVFFILLYYILSV